VIADFFDGSRVQRSRSSGTPSGVRDRSMEFGRASGISHMPPALLQTGVDQHSGRPQHTCPPPPWASSGRWAAEADRRRRPRVPGVSRSEGSQPCPVGRPSPSDPRGRRAQGARRVASNSEPDRPGVRRVANVRGSSEFYRAVFRGPARARDRRHQRPISEPNALPTPPPGRYHQRDVA
jgi:hypothetical protein